MTEKQILSKKQRGDYVLVAQMLTNKLGRYISPMNAAKLIERETATDHQAAVEALKAVVESREKLLQQETTTV
ncbi:hypothetical protein [uncultured Draconibacterium sp.]|uniref:hypothetical protein n=1 Tax=uncultured Draconibacterium sp. TaxID=1573823 RepID=UPI003216A2FF